MIEPFDSLVLRVVLGPMVASIRIFAVYVVIHGHYGPGGGFQGGVLLGSSIVLPMLVHGLGRRPSERTAVALACAGVFIFALTGALALAFDRPMLDYGALPLGAPGPERRALGTLLIELGVGLAVAGVTVSLYRSLMAPELER